MINLNIKEGYIRKIETPEDSKRKLFSLAVRRDFKNKEGKYDYDHFTFFYYSSDRGPAAFIDKYVTDGDLVSVKGHDSSYAVCDENGKKVYHEDKICDELTILVKNKKEERESDSSAEETGKASSEIDEGYSLVDDEDLPF